MKPILLFSFLSCLWLLLGGCVRKSIYQKIEENLNLTIAEKEEYMRLLAQTKRELSKINENKAALQTFSSAEIEAQKVRIVQLEGQVQALSQQLGQCQTAQRNSIIAAENQLKAISQNEAANRARNQKIVKELQDSVFAGLAPNLVVMTIENDKISIVVAENILFKMGAQTIEGNSRVVMSKLANYLRRNSDLYVGLIAYSPQHLAQGRTNNLALFLSEQKIAASRILQFMRQQPARISNNAVEIILSIKGFL
jgi:dsDNA-binding SOS-regulon protein